MFMGLMWWEWNQSHGKTWRHCPVSHGCDYSQVEKRLDIRNWTELTCTVCYIKKSIVLCNDLACICSHATVASIGYVLFGSGGLSMASAVLRSVLFFKLKNRAPGTRIRYRDLCLFWSTEAANSISASCLENLTRNLKFISKPTPHLSVQALAWWKNSFFIQWIF